MSSIKFYPLQADGANYPASVIPTFSPLSCDALQFRSSLVAGSAFTDAGVSFVQGRYALAEALRRAGAGSGKRVLLPAFHCRVIVEAVLYLGAQPCFYPVKADLQPDYVALNDLLHDAVMPVAAMLLTHYFGFPNQLDRAEQFCATHGIRLVEDCAHAFYGHAGGRMLGTVGSYAIASPWKFFPVRDGGVLRDNVAGSQMRRNAQSWLAEASALAVTLQGGWRHGRGGDALPIIEPAALCEQAGLIAARGGRQLDVPGFKEFSVERAALSSLRLSRWGVRHATHERIARRRRAHFLRWLEGVRGLPSVQPLYPDLPEGVVPYAFPLLIDEDAMCFHLLKLAGIPLWRWEDMAVTDCDVSRDYRLRLLQLPCHQELKSEQLDWMIRAVQLLSHRL